jgi:hypothetical protein
MLKWIPSFSKFLLKLVQLGKMFLSLLTIAGNERLKIKKENK